MTRALKKTSTFRAVLRIHDFWRYKVFIYLVVLTLGTITALALDLGFGIPQSTVLVCLAPLMTFMFLAVTLACAALRRAAFAHSDEVAMRGEHYLREGFGIVVAPKNPEVSSVPEMEDLRDKMIEELLRGVREALAEVTTAPKRPYTNFRRYSASRRDRADSRFRFSRRDSDGYRRA